MREGFSADHLKEKIIVAALINCPKAIECMVDDLQGFDFRTSEYRDILRLLFHNLPKTREDAEQQISEAMGSEVLEILWSDNHVQVVSCMKRSHDVDMTIMTVQSELHKLTIQRGLAAELEEVSYAAKQDVDETSVWRLSLIHISEPTRPY